MPACHGPNKKKALQTSDGLIQTQQTPWPTPRRSLRGCPLQILDLFHDASEKAFRARFATRHGRNTLWPACGFERDDALPTVVAVEPSPRTYDLFVQRFALYNASRKILPFNCALLDHVGSVTFLQNKRRGHERNQILQDGLTYGMAPFDSAALERCAKRGRSSGDRRLKRGCDSCAGGWKTVGGQWGKVKKRLAPN